MNEQEIFDLIAQQKFEEAKTLIEQKLQENPDDIEWLKQLGLCQVNLNKHDSALKTFSRVVELKPDDATSHFYIASFYERNFKKEEAIEEYKRVIELRENFIAAYTSLTMLYLNIKDIDNAQKTIEKAYHITQNEERPYLVPYLYANVEILLDNKEFAKELLLESIERNPEHEQSLNTLGCLLMSLNQTDKSMEYYKKALKINKNNPTTHYNIATLYLVQGNLKKAQQHFEKAYKLSPGAHHLSQLAYTQFRNEDYVEAEKSYQKLITQNPQSSNYRFNYAVCLYENKKYTQAISVLLPIVQQNPKSAIMAHRLALCFEALGQIKNAAVIYDKIMKLAKVPPQIYLDYAHLLFLDQDYPRAENILKKIIQIQPDFALAHKDLGIVYLTERLFDEAQQEFETALKLDETNPLINFEYANFLQAVSNFKDAQGFYEKAYKKIGNTESVKLMYALNQYKLGNNDKAKELLEEVIAINPKAHVALYHLAQISYVQKKYELAKEYLTDAYAINADIETTHLLALVYMELKDYHNAKVLLNNLNNQIPDNVAILTTLAKAEILDNKPDMAQNYLEQVIAIFPEAQEAQELLSSLKN